MTFRACSIFNSLFVDFVVVRRLRILQILEANTANAIFVNYSRCRYCDVTIKISKARKPERLISNAKLVFHCSIHSSVLKAIHLRPYLRFFVCLLTLGQRGLAHIFSHGNRGNFSLQRKQVDPNLLVVPLATYKLSKRGNCCTHSRFAIQAMLPMGSES